MCNETVFLLDPFVVYTLPPARTVLSIDVLDIAGTQESDATLSKNIAIHKVRQR